MRLFFAIEIPDTIFNPILEFIGECRSIADRGIKYSNKSNIHLTLKFLGNDVADEQAKSIADGVWQKLKKSSVVIDPIIVQGVGGFPDIFFPRVLWVGIQENLSLVELHKIIDTVSAKNGILAEKRKFRPHLTIARVKSKIPHKLTTNFKENRNTKFGEFTPISFNLIQSVLMPDGAVYTVLEEFKL